MADFRTRLRAEGRLATIDEEAEELGEVDLRQIHAAAVEATLREQWDGLDTKRRADKYARLLLRTAGQLPEAAQIPLARLVLLAGIDGEPPPGRPSRLQRAAKRLESFSLVEELAADEIRLHPLVREFAEACTPVAEVDAFCAELQANLAAASNSKYGFEHHLPEVDVPEVCQNITKLALQLPKMTSGS